MTECPNKTHQDSQVYQPRFPWIPSCLGYDKALGLTGEWGLHGYIYDIRGTCLCNVVMGRGVAYEYMTLHNKVGAADNCHTNLHEFKDIWNLPFVVVLNTFLHVRTCV